MLVSALTGEGLPELLQVLEDEVPRPDVRVSVVLPYDQGSLVSRIHSEGEVLTEEHLEQGTRMEARVGAVVAPTLLIGATDDPFAYPQLVRMGRALPQATSREIPGGTVPLPDHLPEEFAALVAEFVGSVAADT